MSFDFVHDGFGFWFCLGDSRYYKMDRKRFVIEEITKDEYDLANRRRW